MLNFPGLWGEFPNLSMNDENIPHYIIVTQNIPSNLKIEQEIKKFMFLDRFSIIFRTETK